MHRFFRDHGNGDPAHGHPTDCRCHNETRWHGLFHGADKRMAGGGFGGGRGRGHGGIGRLFAHGNLHLVVLHLIAEKPRHGYELIKVIEEMVGGTYTPSPGTIYPALTMLEDQGYVSVSAESGGKKLYHLTDTGKAYLEANRVSIDALIAHMRQTADTQGGEPPAAVIRAVQNLRMALHMRLQRGPVSDAAGASIARALDAAAVEIEQS